MNVIHCEVKPQRMLTIILCLIPKIIILNYLGASKEEKVSLSFCFASLIITFKDWILTTMWLCILLCWYSIPQCNLHLSFSGCLQKTVKGESITTN